MASGPIPSGTGGELEKIRRLVAAEFPVYDTRVGPQSLLLAVQVDPNRLEGSFDRLRRAMWAAGYVVILRYQRGEHFLEVVPRPKARTSRQWVNLALLLATVATTTLAGALIWVTYVGGSTLTTTDFVYGALFFSLPVLTILGLHELAHYAMARRRGIDASLPYFIPLPPPFLFGTFGAFISIREPFPDKKALFDIGVAGPLAGFAASIPFALVGLYLSGHSPVLPATYCGPTLLGVSYGNLILGVPLFWEVLSLFFPPSLVSLHPLALAGWVGIFVTAINLLPAGQLDGGHVFRALFGDRVRYVSYAAVLVLVGLGLFYVGWIFFAILIMLLGVRHPPPLNDVSRLDTKRYVVGALAIGVLLSGFVITPIASPQGVVDLQSGAIQYPPPPPGVAVYATLHLTVVNGDPVPHGVVLSASVTNVSVRANNTTTYLTGAALAAWAQRSTWTFALPNGTMYTLAGADVTLPSQDYLTVNATSADHSSAFALTLSNPTGAAGVVVQVTAQELCAQIGGSASQTVALTTG